MTGTLPYITKHAITRTDLYSQVVTFTEVKSSLFSVHNFQVGGQTYVKVKALPQVVDIVDQEGKHHMGDTVFAVVQRDDENEPGRVVTVLLRNATQPARAFRRNEEIPQHMKN